MHVLNRHERDLAATLARAGELLDSLASPGDRLWPHRDWPRMKLDRPLGVGAAGGHGPIRYVVEAYRPGTSIRFRFTAPRGFVGYHQFEVLASGPGRVTLRHSLEMQTRGPATLSWPLVYRPLHDALVEDALTNAEVTLGVPPHPVAWTPRVRVLRRMLAR